MKKIKFWAVLALLFILPGFAPAGEQPKYIFLLIGDGMGPTIRQYYQQEFPDSSLESFPVKVMTGTNNYKNVTTDSAASGTAIACGIKTYNHAIGVTPEKKPVTSLAKIFRDKGYSVGIITSVGLNDATPSAHYANRLTRRDYAGILSDLVASNFDFFAGGRLLLPPKYQVKDFEKLLKQCKYQLRTSYDFNANAPARRVVYVGSMEPDWPAYPQKRHILSENIKFAAEKLSRNPKGFFIMAEGGAIDGGGHANDLAMTMREMREFDIAVKTALEFYKKHPKDTLIVITSDHDTGGMNIDKVVKNSFWQKQARYSGLVQKDFVKMLKKSTDEELIKFLAQEFALENLTAAETDALRKAIAIERDPKAREKVVYRSMYGRYNPAVVTARHLRDARHGISWTHFSHTPRKVITNAIGVGQDEFKSVKENTDIPRAISRAAFGENLMDKANKTLPVLTEKVFEEYFNFITATPDKLIFRYGQKKEAELEFFLNGKLIAKRNDRAGRVVFDQLAPATAYEVVVKRSGKVAAQRKIVTPVEPQGKLLLKMGLVADPHLSLKPDVRYGRLHSKSIEALHNAFADLSGKCDFIAMPGDVTDASTAEEMKAVADLLKKFPKTKVYAVPGNHDLMERKAFGKFWKKNFGGARLEKHGNIQILLLDTWNGKLTDKPENIKAIEALDPAKPVIIFSHFQLTASVKIKIKDSFLRDDPAAEKYLQKLSTMRGMILVGHKNIAVTAKLGNLVQINLPQLTQFPAGYIYAKVYTDGVLLEFCPGLDEFFDEYSRIRSVLFTQNAARRDKFSLPVWNAFYPMVLK